MQFDSVVQALNNLYLTNRRKFIAQQQDGTYREIKRYSKSGKQFIKIFTDNTLENHLNGTQTIGIFAGKHVTKFICFDVDTKANSRKDTDYLRNVLIYGFGIDDKYIHISDSGNKGYHVEMFFKDPINNEAIKDLYNRVLKHGNFTPNQVELRPLYQTGVKLPLGIHKVTGRRCNFVNKDNFDEVYNADYVRTIEQIDTDKFIKDLDLKQQQLTVIETSKIKANEDNPIQKFRKIAVGLDLTLYEVENLDKNLQEMLKTGVLIYPDTRNKYTYLLSIYLKELGYNVEDSIVIINEIMLNTKRNHEGFIQSSEKHITYETQKIVKNTHKKNYVIQNVQREVALYEDEFKEILSVKGIHLQRLYAAMMIHAKRYGTVSKPFYMAYSVMTSMGNAENRSKLRSYINQLSDRIEVVESDVIDVPRSKQLGFAIRKPNVYRIKKSFNQNSDQKVLIKADATNVDIIEILQEAYTHNVISLADVKRSLAKNTFIKFKQSL